MVRLALTGVLLVSLSQKLPSKLPFCADAPGARVPSQLLPVDQAAKQPEFFTYRARLARAVAEKDLTFVLSAADRDIKMGFGGNDGIDVLKAELTGSEKDRYWRELATILALGGSFHGPDAFHAPYVYSEWRDGVDSFECAAVLGRNVQLRQRASTESPSVARLDYSIVRLILDSGNPEGWLAVQTAKGQRGYVRDDLVRGPTFMRAIFNKIDGRWRLTALVSGD